LNSSTVVPRLMRHLHWNLTRRFSLQIELCDFLVNLNAANLHLGSVQAYKSWASWAKILGQLSKNPGYFLLLGWNNSRSSKVNLREGWVIRLQRIYNFWFSMLVFTPFA
jgi:hypothetical protein